jgi:hypothetical protein
MESGRKGQLRQLCTPFLKEYRNPLKEKENQIGIFRDLTKAYNDINRGILLAKLNSYGVRSIVYSLFQS